MREFKKRRSRRGELLQLGLRFLGVLLLCGITVLAVRGAWGMYGKFTEAVYGQDVAEAELANLEQQKAQVSAAVSEISSPRGVEAQIRQRFGVVKPGEGEIQLVRDAAAATGTQTAPKSIWHRIFRALFVW